MQTSPVGTDEYWATLSRPSGTVMFRGHPIAAMNRWAIIIMSLRDDGKRDHPSERRASRKLNADDFALYYYKE